MQDNENIAIIGSSPICLIQAILESRAGNNVVVFEKENRIGGAWNIERLKFGIEVETACHLIENYGSSYKILEKYSGVDFEWVIPVPVKIYNNSKKIVYSSRMNILREMYRFTALVVVQYIAMAVPFNVVKLQKLKKFGKAERYNNLKNYMNFVKFRLPKAIFGADIMHPKNGVVAMIDGFYKNCLECGVKFTYREVTNIQLGPQCNVYSGKSNVGRFDKIYISSSVSLKYDGSKNLISAERTDNKYWHALFSVDIVEINDLPQYIHFPDDENVHRITILDSLSGKQSDSNYFLVQFRKKFSAGQRATLLLQLINRHQIFKTRSDVKIELKEEKIFSEKFVSSSASSVLLESIKRKQLSIASDKIFVMDSIGDLARVVASWKLAR